MNRHQKKFLGTAVAILNVAFSLSVGAIATYAWFQANASANITTTTADATLSVKSPDLTLDKVEVYKYDFRENVKKGICVDTDNDTAIAAFQLAKYEAFLKDSGNGEFNNPYTNCIMKISFDATNFDSSKKEIRIGLMCSTSDYDGYDAQHPKYVKSVTSNIAAFKAVVHDFSVEESDVVTNVSGVTIDKTDASAINTTYENLTSYFQKIETPCTFVSMNKRGKGFRKLQNTITICPDIPDNKKIDKISLLVEASYDEALVDNLIRTHRGDNFDFFNVTGDITNFEFDLLDYEAGKAGIASTGLYTKFVSDYHIDDGNYLLAYRKLSGTEQDPATPNSAKVFNGSLPGGAGGTIGSANNYYDNIYVDTTGSQPKIASNNKTNTAAVRYEVDSNKLMASNFTYDSTNDKCVDANYTTSNRDRIGFGETTGSGVNKSNSNYKNEISMLRTPDNAYGSVICTTSPTNTDLTNQFLYKPSDNYFRYYASGLSGTERPEIFRYYSNQPSIGNIVRLEVDPDSRVNYNSTDTFVIEPSEQHPNTTITVYAVFQDGGKMDITDLCTYSINGNTVQSEITNVSVGTAQKTIEISYTDKDGTVLTPITFDISITAKAEGELEVDGSHVISQYCFEEPNFSGLTGVLTFTNGDEEVIQDVSLDPRFVIESTQIETYDGGTSKRWKKVTSDTVATVTVKLASNPAVYDTFETTVKAYRIVFNTIQNATYDETTNCYEFNTTDSPVISINTSESLPTSGVSYIWSSLNSSVIETSSGATSTSCTFTPVAVGETKIRCTIANTDNEIYEEINVRIVTARRYICVTNSMSNYSGRYLLCFENFSGSTLTSAYIWNGERAASNYVSTSTLNTLVTSGDVPYIATNSRAYNSCEFIIDKIEGTNYYSLKYGDDYYSCTNYGIVKSSSPVYMTIERFADSRAVKIYNSSKGNDYSIQFTSNQFKQDSLASASGQSITLYRLEDAKSSVSLVDNDSNGAPDTTAKCGTSYYCKAQITPGRDGQGLSNLTVTVKTGGNVVSGANISVNTSTGLITWAIPNNTCGEYVITATLANNNADFTNPAIKVYKLHSITLGTKSGSQTSGSTFSYSGTITAHYTCNGSTLDSSMDDNTISFSNCSNNAAQYMSSVGTHTVSISYTEAGVTKSDTYSLTINAQPSGSETVTFDFTTDISDFASWGSGYDKHTVYFTEGEVIFASANKNTTEITDRPVTKGNDVEFYLYDGEITSFEFECLQWTDKTHTISYECSDDLGDTLTSGSQTSDNFTLTVSTLPISNVNYLVFHFSGTKQIGITSLTITYVPS